LVWIDILGEISIGDIGFGGWSLGLDEAEHSQNLQFKGSLINNRWEEVKTLQPLGF